MGSFSILSDISVLGGQNMLDINKVGCYRGINCGETAERVDAGGSGSDDKVDFRTSESLRAADYARNHAERDANGGIGFLPTDAAAPEKITVINNSKFDPKLDPYTKAEIAQLREKEMMGALSPIDTARLAFLTGAGAFWKRPDPIMVDISETSSVNVDLGLITMVIGMDGKLKIDGFAGGRGGPGGY